MYAIRSYYELKGFVNEVGYVAKSGVITSYSIHYTKLYDAFDAMDDWMSEFYAVARIALEEKPQLLEVLGKHVKS